MKISVFGCGRWGSFIAWYLDKIGHNVTLWGRETSEHLKQIKETRKNGLLEFRKSMEVTTNTEGTVKSAEAVVISIRAQSLRSFLGSLSHLKEELEQKTIILCMKGIEVETGKRLTEIVGEHLPNNKKIAVWVGPGHVQNISSGVPTCMVIDSDNEDTKNFLVKEFSSDLIRFYYGTDLIGNEIGAAAKNVIGVAAGILDGLGYEGLKGALMARGTYEVSKLIEKMGGNKLSTYGLAHLGDYQATLFSKFGNNRLYGEFFVKGEKSGKLAEGVYNSKAIFNIAQKMNLDLPIFTAVYKVLFENLDAKESIKLLFERPVKTEF